MADAVPKGRNMDTPLDPDFADHEDYFCWLLDRVMRWDGGYAVVLDAYFDASKRDGGVFCVAGYAFGSDGANKATRDWKRLWEDTQSHMTDMSATPPGGDFKGWSADQTKERIEAAVPIINRWAQFGVAVSVDISELAALAPTNADPGSMILLGGLSGPYAVCCHAAMAAMAQLTGNEDIAYFFEFGDDRQAESAAFTNYLLTHRNVARRLYGMRAYAVLDAADSRLFEMADILAWEWAKHVERDNARYPLDANGVTRQRGSLRALLGDGIYRSRETNIISTTRRGWHLTGAPLQRYYQRVNEFELLSDRPSDQALERIRSAIREEF
jgi:hypothetical protein